MKISVLVWDHWFCSLTTRQWSHHWRVANGIAHMLDCRINDETNRSWPLTSEQKINKQDVSAHEHDQRHVGPRKISHNTMSVSVTWVKNQIWPHTLLSRAGALRALARASARYYTVTIPCSDQDYNINWVDLDLYVIQIYIHQSSLCRSIYESV